MRGGLDGGEGEIDCVSDLVYECRDLDGHGG